MKYRPGLFIPIFMFISATVISGFVSSSETSHGSSQRYNGFIVLPGLTDSVKVYRDERGMPHIYALNEHDLYMTVGYISAQERLWQQGDLLFELYIYKLLTTGSGDRVDNINTPDKETLNDIVRQSFKESINSLVRQNGRNPENWKWGKIHTLTFMHPFGSIHILASVFNLNSDKYSVGGDEFTVCPYFSYKPGFKADLGASVRHIFNTADWDESYSVIPGGASGVPRSEFYLSQVKTYVEGRFYKDRFSDAEVKSSSEYYQIFVPDEIIYSFIGVNNKNSARSRPEVTLKQLK